MTELSKYKPLPADSIRAQTANGTPACVLTWVNKPDGTIRLYASRDIPPQGWGQRTTSSGTVDWHLETTLRNVLIIDKPTPAEAIAWVLERWAREDAEKSERDQLESRRAIAQAGKGTAISGTGQL